MNEIEHDAKVDMYSEIQEIRSVREQRRKLSEREAELTAPTLTDLDQIGRLYGWFQEIMAGRERPGRVDDVSRRKKFIFLILFLYSPGTLAGGKMAKGVRDRVAGVFDISPVVISNNFNNAIFMYQRHRPFREDMEWLFAQVMRRIGPLVAGARQ